MKMKNHVPRRSGSVGTAANQGPRQVLAPVEPKARRRRRRFRGPKVCGAAHPDHPAIRCTSEIQYRDGKPVKHLGKHRSRVLRGITTRWEA